ncbi:MAG: PH domain-containing protein [Clostridia bacterium]|nr:PH domain-containing protein [Clostridia bacterium]
MSDRNTEFVWQDRKRILFGLPWSFTRYFLKEDKLIIDTGFFSRTEEEIRLYRITDVTLRRKLWERMCGLGTIHCCSGDKTSPEFDIAHVKDARRVKEMLSDMVEEARDKRRVGVREFMGADEEAMEDFDDLHDER